MVNWNGAEDAIRKLKWASEAEPKDSETVARIREGVTGLCAALEIPLGLVDTDEHAKAAAFDSVRHHVLGLGIAVPTEPNGARARLLALIDEWRDKYTTAHVGLASVLDALDQRPADAAAAVSAIESLQDRLIEARNEGAHAVAMADDLDRIGARLKEFGVSVDASPRILGETMAVIAHTANLRQALGLSGLSGKDAFERINDLRRSSRSLPELHTALGDAKQNHAALLMKLDLVLDGVVPDPNEVDPVARVQHLVKLYREVLAEMALEGDDEDVLAAVGMPHATSPTQSDFVPLADRQSEPEPAPPVTTRGDRAAALDAVVAVVTASPTDWSRSPDLAWIYAVLVGLDEDDLEMTAIKHGWSEAAIAVIERHAAALAAVREGA